MQFIGQYEKGEQASTFIEFTHEDQKEKLDLHRCRLESNLTSSIRQKYVGADSTFVALVQAGAHSFHIWPHDGEEGRD